MGNQSTHNALGQAVHRVEDRMGRIQVEGRYHHMCGRVEEDYLLEKTMVLGSGANGGVVLAENRHTGMKVAVKTLPLNHLSSEKKSELLNEVEVFLRMDHPHVARLYEVYENEDSLIFVMEYMDGGELYDRVAEKKVFPESDAAEATWQMLLAINYLHTEGIVHRDIKLENFLFESKGSNYLKLIDFGFSKVCPKNGGLNVSCGTISYVAPEVLEKNYGSKCDLWSLGVVVFVMLAGYMPFSGKSDEEILEAIRIGKYVMKSKRWAQVSNHALHFVKNLLVVEPQYRFSAEQALVHPWICERHKLTSDNSALDESIATSLVTFARQTRFRRACMQLMAWSLSREERAEVRGAFLELDQHHTGVIKLTELKQVLEERFHIAPEVCRSVVAAFQNLDHESDTEIHYSDFLAAMMCSRLRLHDDLLKESFRHFDTESHGYITLSNLRQVLGNEPEVEEVFNLVDQDKDGHISVEELVNYLRTAESGDVGAESVAHGLIDHELQRRGASTISSPRLGSFDEGHHGMGLVTLAIRRFGTGFKRRRSRTGDLGTMMTPKAQSPTGGTGETGNGAAEPHHCNGHTGVQPG